MTIPQNDKQHVSSRRNLNCHDKQWFIWHKFPSLLYRKTKVSNSSLSFHKYAKKIASWLQSLCCSSNLYKVDTLNAPLKTPVVACHWTSYSVNESYNKNYTSVSTEISINISDNWTSVRENFLKSRKMRGKMSPVHNLHLALWLLSYTVVVLH